jgi:hypothetical protein
MILAEILKQPAKFDCLKNPVVLQLEALEYTPFHLIALILFVLAIVHTLCVYKVHEWAHALEMKQKERGKEKGVGIQTLYFLAEVEIVFAFWAVVLFIFMASFYGWTTALEYIDTRDYTEALFVVVILAMASTKPIIHIAEVLISWLAKKLGGSLSAWWFVLLTVGPLLGSFITEAAAMALCAFLLSHQFYTYHPSSKLAYATLALLFVNVSIGGVLTNFASPAVLVLSHFWKWTISDIFLNFGWKAILGILLSNGLYWLYFRKELQDLNVRKKAFKVYVEHSTPTERPIPVWVTTTHILFMTWIVFVSSYPAIFLAAFLLFIGFYQATRAYQHSLQLTRPLLIGLFLAGLVIHGGLQGWWVYAILHDLSPLSVMGVAIALTGFNDNTAISYLATLIPNWGDIYEYAIFIGVVAGGGLTVIANAPNPAGYSILRSHFTRGVKPFPLLLAALPPTCILYAIYYFLGPLF